MSNYVYLDMITEITRKEQCHEDKYQNLKDKYIVIMEYLLTFTGVEWVKWTIHLPSRTKRHTRRPNDWQLIYLFLSWKAGTLLPMLYGPFNVQEEVCDMS